jgi:hypothetical protein
MANANLPWKQNECFRNPGWHYFEDVKTSGNYAENVHARFVAGNLAENSVFMDLHIPGFDQREYSEVNAPHTFEAPRYYLEKPTPTMIIRKSGEAWIEPFVVVFEPFSANEKSIVSVEKLTQNGVYKGLKVESSVEGTTLIQYILTLAGNETYDDKTSGIFLKGRFAVITCNKKGDLLNIYMGEGSEIRYKNTIIKVEVDSASAYLSLTTDKPELKSNKPEKVTYSISN